MQCSITVENDRASGNKMKSNSYKNPYRKESNLDNIVDQLCTRLQDIKDQDNPRVGMPTVAVEHSEAVRRYYAAFPALRRGEESPPQYYLPPPAWCRRPSNMQGEAARDWNKHKKFTGKERRNSYHGQKKNKKRCNSYSRSFDSKECLPEWVTSEGVWDMDTQDPVKEFIRAIALDEGYGTCENTVVDEVKEITRAKIRMSENVVPDWDDSLDLDSEWVINEDLKPKVRTPMEEELYAKFEAKFDRSIEALWAKQNTPDDEYQDLPIDFQDLLSSPSDRLFADPSAEKCSLISLTESIWSTDGFGARESPSRMAEALHDRFRPLNLADPPEPPRAPAPPREMLSLFYEGEQQDPLCAAASTLRSLAAINHSRDRSGFVEVPPRRPRAAPRAPPRPAEPREPSRPREDLLTSSRTHFRPIRREADTEARYVDGDTFDIRGDLESVEMTRSESGGMYFNSELYLEYRAEHTIDYTRLNLTAAQRCPDLEDPNFRLRFPVKQTDAGVQTDGAGGACECGRNAKKKRPSGMESIWAVCAGCARGGAPPAAPAPAPAPAPPDHAREWEELLADISAAHAEYLRAEVVEETLARADRKRRHSAARAPAACSHPHARFLHCCALQDRPLTR